MGYERERVGQQPPSSYEEMLEFRGAGPYGRQPDDIQAVEPTLLAARTALLVQATLSAHAPRLPEHVIWAAAEAAGLAITKRKDR